MSPFSLPPRPVVILGAGGHAFVVAEALGLTRRELAGYISPVPTAIVGRDTELGPYLGDDSVLPDILTRFDLALGIGFVDAAGAMRRAALLNLLEHRNAQLICVVHPQAIVSASAQIAAGAFIAMGAIIGTCAKIGRGSIVNSGAVIDHDSQLAENCHLATGARLAGGITVGRDVLIGAGAVLRQGLSVGAGAIIGAGAVVIRPVEAGSTVFGNPARAKMF